jgi:long-chain acyl-CoA synthetase
MAGDGHTNGAHRNGVAGRTGNGVHPPVVDTRRKAPADGTLDVASELSSRRFVVFGGTGFLGKVWLSLILCRYPGIGHLYLLVRAKKDQGSEDRFYSSIATSEVMRPLREIHGDDYETFLRSKITPIDGDVTLPDCGIPPEMLAGLAGTITAVVNVSGVVDFSPPLDEALEVNAFGVQNLIDLARKLGDVPIQHTSTCYVAGNRSGQVDEVDPREFPFPRADELDRSHWDPTREIAECMDLVKQARQRCEDAFRQSRFVDEAKTNLEARNEPAYGQVLEEEVQRVRRRFVEKQLIDAGMERARFWGWPNIYTYTKSLGEQTLAASGLRFTIVRPAVIESSVGFPFAGWNEGINTSAPLLYAIVNGLAQFPSGERTALDVIPVDMVASVMILALGALVQGTQKPVYQCGASDLNGVPVKRLIELSSLYKRKHWEKENKNPLQSFIMRHYEAVPVLPDRFKIHGSPGIGVAAKGLAWALRKAAVGPIAGGMKPVAKAVHEYGEFASRNGELIDMFMPFLTNEYVFSCASTRGLWQRATEADRSGLDWSPEKIDWRHYWMEVHAPGLEKWVFPQIEEKQKKSLRQARRHETLVSLLDEMADRHDLTVALQRLEPDGLSRVSFREWRQTSNAIAARLAVAGISRGDRVLLSGVNHPAWPMAYFGILKAGGVAVPVDPTLEASQLSNVLRSSGARVALWDDDVEKKGGHQARREVPGVSVFDLHRFAESDPHAVSPEIHLQSADIASIIYTSGTTGTPKGVMLTHANFTSLLSSIAPIFPLRSSDRMLSVLPLHHTFEFACGLLLPLSAGARIIYLDELNGERLSKALSEGRVTAMAGVPALWQLLEHKILAQAEERGVLAEKYLEWGGELNRALGKRLGVDAGKLLFAPIHAALGGNIRYLVSGGAALPEATQKFFAGLGLHLAEGYGLTEASPVLTVQTGSPKAKPGSVGKPIPGVELRVMNPDASGVGEVVARGPNVMLGYENNPEATRAVLEDGWLKTGDLGKLDREGRLTIVGRAKDVIVNASGENVYPDDVENLLGRIPHVTEFAIAGVDNPGGGERVGMLARPAAAETEDEDRSERFSRARAAIRDAVESLPASARPAIVQLYDAELPKTVTRKVKRTEVRKILERMAAASVPVTAEVEGTTPIRAAVARLAHRKPHEIHATTRFQADLGFDSLLMMELVVTLEQHLGGRALPDDLARVETVGEAEKLLGEAPAPLAKKGARSKEPEGIVVPEPVKAAVKTVLGRAQKALYENVLETRVTGRAYIPHNRNVIVVANHTSHLDMGLVKHALGSYGEGIVTLAASDYFFDDRWKRAYFENFTNLAALDRKGSIARTLKQAGEIIEQGKTVLIFPEGTRSQDGQIQEFKRAVAHLAVTYQVDVLPVYLRGTYQAMPRGATLPSGRAVSAHIGPVLKMSDLERVTEGLKFGDRVRTITQIIQRAVEALRDRDVVDLARTTREQAARLLGPREHPLVKLFRDLELKFQQGAVEQPVSFYFTLGTEPEAKWYCIAAPDRCSIVNGKPPTGTADCVLKTNADLFTRIVREAYVPGIDEFVSGAIKSNDVSLLATFQKVFNLIEKSAT